MSLGYVTRELEHKFDIPRDVSAEAVVDALDAFTHEMTDRVQRVQCEGHFTYFDDPHLSLLQRGETFRYRCVTRVRDGKRSEWAGSYDYKTGTVNSVARVEKSWRQDYTEHGQVESVIKVWQIGIKKADAVAIVCTTHEKWGFFTKNKRPVEVSYDRFFSDEAHRDLLFQELEIEYGKDIDPSSVQSYRKELDAIAECLIKVHGATLKLSPIDVQKYLRVMRQLYPAKVLIAAFAYAFHVHTDAPVKPRKAWRRHDSLTPQAVHPSWGAMTILQEPTLPWSLRWNGALALALHDVLEDTTACLPDGTTKEVRRFVEEMTFENYGAELDSWWKLSAEAKLLKLYDKVSNLLDGSWMPKEKLALYRFYTLQLAQAAEKEFGDLNIVRIARAIASSERP